MIFISQPSSDGAIHKGFCLIFTALKLSCIICGKLISKVTWVHCFAAVVMQPHHKSGVIVPIWKSVCVRASWRPTPHLFGKMQMRVIKSNHRCLLGCTVHQGCNLVVHSLSTQGSSFFYFKPLCNTSRTFKLRSWWSNAGVLFLASQLRRNVCRSIYNVIRTFSNSRTKQWFSRWKSSPVINFCKPQLGKTASKPVTTIRESASTFVTHKPLDIIKETPLLKTAFQHL